jgi:hypothetical protein
MTSLDVARPRLAEPPTVRLLHEAGEDECPDCGGALVVVDDDGTVSGTVGGLIDCMCVALSDPPGFAACGSLHPVADPALDQYLAFCDAAGMEPAWCLRCGAYLPMCDGARPLCWCACSPVRLNEAELAAFDSGAER